jgi:hypothetical protein
MKKGLINKLLYRITPTVLAIGVACGNPIEPPPEPNNPPVIEFSVTPPSGMSPLEVRVKGICKDPDNDLKSFKIMSNGDLLTTTNPTDKTYSLNQDNSYTAECEDMRGNKVSAGPLSVSVTQPPPQGSVSQTFTLENDVNASRSVSFVNITEATIKTLHNDTLVNTKTIITSPYTENLENLLIGNWMSIVSAEGVKPDTARLNIPPYTIGVPDLSQLELELNEGDSIVRHIQRPISINFEKNPVKYLSVSNPDSKVIASIGSFPNDTVLTVKAKDDVSGPYQLEFDFDGNTENANAQGSVIDLPRFSGRIEDTKTKTGTYAQIRFFNTTDTTTSVHEGFTDSQGNFNVRLNTPIPEVYIQARLETENFPDSNFVRTEKFQGRDTTEILMRAHSYNPILENISVNRENLRKHAEELNPIILKSYADSLELINIDPFVRGTLNSDLQKLIRIKASDPLDIGCYLPEKQLYVQIDSLLTQEEHYEIRQFNIDGVIINRIVPDSGWNIGTGNDSLGSGGKSGMFDLYRHYFEIGGLGDPERVAAHELGHRFIAQGNSHASTLTKNQTIMRGDVPSPFASPTVADCEVAKIIYEPTYKTGGNYGTILGLKFYNQQ